MTSQTWTYGGAHVQERGTLFRVFASTAKVCAVRRFKDASHALETVAMQQTPEGLFEVLLEDWGPGTLYKFVLDGRELPDPYARYLPHGVHGPAMVMAPGFRARSKRALGRASGEESKRALGHASGELPEQPEPHAAIRIPHLESVVHRPLANQVIYELHIGTFTEEGTYRAAQERLPALVDLGITTLELLPLSSFAGKRGWGYDGVAHFAPFARYGTPDELRALIDAAHAAGLSVLLDVVYNHFGPAGNYLEAFSPLYFAASASNPWGKSLDFTHPVMREYVLSNARYWFDEFGFDGLRLDAVHAMVDPSPTHVLSDLSELARSYHPPKLLIAEDDRNDPALIEVHGLDAVWADDFHHQLRVTLTGERDGYYAAYEPSVAQLARTIEQGFLYEGQVHPSSGKARGKPARDLPASAFVYCIQNHDQIGNRALGDRLIQKVSLDCYCLASAILLFLPMTPLLFMGQEWAASTPFLYFTDHEVELGKLVSAGRREEFKGFPAFTDASARARIPDPQAIGTFEASRLIWSERDEPTHRQVLNVYRTMLELRRSDRVLRTATRAQLSAEASGEVLTIRRWIGTDERVLHANFGRAPQARASLGLMPHCSVLFDSARTRQFLASEPEGAQSLDRAPELQPGQVLVVAQVRSASTRALARVSEGPGRA